MLMLKRAPVSLFVVSSSNVSGKIKRTLPGGVKQRNTILWPRLIVSSIIYAMAFPVLVFSKKHKF